MTKETKHELDTHREAIKEKIKENLEIFQPKIVTYSFRIERETIEAAKKEAAGSSISTAAFIRQAIEEKIRNDGRMDKIEKRLSKLENN